MFGFENIPSLKKILWNESKQKPLSSFMAICFAWAIAATLNPSFLYASDREWIIGNQNQSDIPPTCSMPKPRNDNLASSSIENFAERLSIENIGPYWESGIKISWARKIDSSKFPTVSFRLKPELWKWNLISLPSENLRFIVSKPDVEWINESQSIDFVSARAIALDPDWRWHFVFGWEEHLFMRDLLAESAEPFKMIKNYDWNPWKSVNSIVKCSQSSWPTDGNIYFEKFHVFPSYGNFMIWVEKLFNSTYLSIASDPLNWTNFRKKFLFDLDVTKNDDWTYTYDSDWKFTHLCQVDISKYWTKRFRQCYKQEGVPYKVDEIFESRGEIEKKPKWKSIVVFMQHYAWRLIHGLWKELGRDCFRPKPRKRFR